MKNRCALDVIILGVTFCVTLADATTSLDLFSRKTLAASPTTTLGGIELVTIPAGEFKMGSPATEFGHDAREKERNTRIRKPFLLATYETTVAQYKSLMDPAYKPARGDNKTPVTKVSWEDAERFCKALSKKLGRTVRLPDEDEWEYACRAGTTGPLAVWKGSLESDLAKLKAGSTSQFHQRVTKILNSGTSGVKPVGSYPCNAYGLYDMHGNVWEWCRRLSSSIDNDAPGLRHRPIRGGSWVSREWTDCRSAKRAWELKDKQKESIGFRVLVEIP